MQQDDVGFILKHAASHKLLTKEEEQEYARIYAESRKRGATEHDRKRGERAKQKLILGNVRLVVSIARKRAAKEVSLSLSDLIQEGCVGLSRAAERFDYTQGWRFSTYAYWWVRQSVLQAASQENRPLLVPSHILEKATKARYIKQKIEIEQGRTPSLGEVAEALKVQPATLKRYLLMAAPLISIDSSLEGAKTVEVSTEDPSLEVMEQQKEIEARLGELPENMQFILCHTFGLKNCDILKFAAIGRLLSPSCSAKKTEALLNDALALLRDKMTATESVPVIEQTIASVPFKLTVTSAISASEGREILETLNYIRLAVMLFYGLEGKKSHHVKAISKQLGFTLARTQSLLEIAQALIKEPEQNIVLAKRISKKKAIAPGQMSLFYEGNMFQENKQNPDPFEAALVQKAITANKAGVKQAKSQVPVQTGALRDTIELSEAEQNGNMVTIAITAGNDQVNYAYEQEMLHTPFLRPALARVESELKSLVS